MKLKDKLGLFKRENILLKIPVAIKPINKNGQLPILAAPDSELFGVLLFQTLPTMTFQKNSKGIPTNQPGVSCSEWSTLALWATRV